MQARACVDAKAVRYVGVKAAEHDGELFEVKMAWLASVWQEHSAEARRLDEETEKNLSKLGF